MYLKKYVIHPFKIKGYILTNFAIPWKNPVESTGIAFCDIAVHIFARIGPFQTYIYNSKQYYFADFYFNTNKKNGENNTIP